MMRFLTFTLIIISSIVVFSTIALADFSADVVTTAVVDNKTVITHGRIYSTSSDGYDGAAKIRYEEVTIDENNKTKTSVLIIDKTKQISYVLIPEQKLYIEGAYPIMSMRYSNLMVAKPVSKKLYKKGKFDGQAVKAYKAKSQSGKKMVVWEAVKMKNFPVRVEFPDDLSTLEYHNISRDGLEADMFEIPADYTSIKQEAQTNS